MKLELKHLACYLPYGLKVMTEKGIDNLCGTMWAYDFDYKSERPKYYHKADHILANCEHQTYELYDIKPILRPLFDFNTIWQNNDEIYQEYREIKSDKAFGFETIFVNEFNNAFVEFGDHSVGYSLNFEALPILLFLFKHHFDVFGLIDAGLAINMNTLDL